MRDPLDHLWALLTTHEILTNSQVADLMRGEFVTGTVIET
jgi:hypothetical protein